MFPAWLGHVTWLVATTVTSCLLLSDHAIAASLVAGRQPAPDVDSTSGRRQLPVLSGSERQRMRRHRGARRYSHSEDDLQTVDYSHRRPWQINRGKSVADPGIWNGGGGFPLPFLQPSSSFCLPLSSLFPSLPSFPLELGLLNLVRVSGSSGEGCKLP